MRGLRTLGAALRRPRYFVIVALAAAVVGVGGARWWTTSRPVRFAGTTLEFVALGRVDQPLLKAVAGDTARAYHLPSCVMPTEVALPAEAHLADRDQYLADRLLDLLPPPPDRRTQRLYVTEADITYPGMSFLFGLSHPRTRSAVLSLARFRQAEARSHDGPAVLRQRVAKIAVHELGHSFGFDHCADPRCVMHYSDSVAGVDETEVGFCARCRERIRQRP